MMTPNHIRLDIQAMSIQHGTYTAACFGEIITKIISRGIVETEGSIVFICQVLPKTNEPIRMKLQKIEFGDQSML
jgi:hypothetical protein